jgi:hypothetical protein
MKPLSEPSSIQAAAPAPWRHAPFYVRADMLSQWTKTTAEFLAQSAALMRVSLASTKLSQKKNSDL